jgi:hypothetical protein
VLDARKSKEIGTELNNLRSRITAAKQNKEDALKAYTKNIDSLESEALWLQREYDKAWELERPARIQKMNDGRNCHIVSGMLQELANH